MLEKHLVVIHRKTMLKFYLILFAMIFHAFSLFAQKSTIKSLDNPQATYWGIKAPESLQDSQMCKSCRPYPHKNRILGFEEKSDGYWFYTNDIALADNLFTQKRKDGLSLEFVPKEPVLCGNNQYSTMPSRRNRKSLFNGVISKPVYKRKVSKYWRKQKKEFRKQQKREIAALKDTMPANTKIQKLDRTKAILIAKGQEYNRSDLRVFLGKNPMADRSPGNYDINAIYLKDKKVCHIQHFTNLRGELYNELEDVPLVFDWRNRRDCELEFLPEMMVESYRIPFDKGSGKSDLTQLKNSIVKLTNDGFIITHVGILPFASVEGPKPINNCLKYERAETLIAAIEDAYGNNNFTRSIEPQINWKLFREQLANDSDPRVKKLSKRSERYLKKLVDDPKYATIFEPYLEEQRKASVRIHFERELTDAGRRDYALDTFHGLLKKAKADSTAPLYRQHLEEALCWQKYIYEQVKESASRKHLVDNMQIPDYPEFGQLLNNYFQMLKMHQSKTDIPFVTRGNNHEPSNKDKYRILGYGINTKNATPLSVYNYLNFLIDHWDADTLYDPAVSPDSMFKLIEYIAPKAHRNPDMTIEALKVNYRLRLANYCMKVDSTRNTLVKSLEEVADYYEKRKVDKKRAMGLARLFIEGNRRNLARDILEPLIIKEHPDPEVFSLYLKLSYSHSDENPDTYFYMQLLDARNKLSNKDWCKLFKAPEALEFQVLDNKAVREIYCEVCQ